MTIDNTSTTNENTVTQDNDTSTQNDVNMNNVNTTTENTKTEKNSTQEWLAYELHTWALENRVMLRQLLTVDNVSHAWQGTTLTVHHSLEEKVDALISEVQSSYSLDITSDDDLTSYDISEWTHEMRAELSEQLTRLMVAHTLQTEQTTGRDADRDADTEQTTDQAQESTQMLTHELIVRESDEEKADLLIEDMLTRAQEVNMVELDGLAVNSLLSSLFVACDRLKRNCHDVTGVSEATRHTQQLVQVKTPFGFSAVQWHELQEKARTLLNLIGSEDADPEELQGLAQLIRDSLQTVI